MNDFATSFEVAASGMQAQARRLRHVSENVANADTPGYHRKLIRFDPAMRGFGARPATVTLSPVVLDPAPLEQVHAPGHPLADASGHYAGSNVDLLVEIADAREAQRSYEANLRMFDQTRQMASGLLELLRR